MIWDFGDPFTDEPTEEEYNREIARIEEFRKRNPNARIFSKMKRRVYCPRCHEQMKIDYGICICHKCSAWITDELTIIMPDGSRKTLYELSPKRYNRIKKSLSGYDCLDKLK